MSNKQKTGLTTAEVAAAQSRYGLNVLTPPPSTPWWKLLLDKFKDPIIIILCVAAGLSIITGIFEGSYVEPIGIIVAIALSTGIGFWMEWSAKKKFDALNTLSDSEGVKVIRNSETCIISKDQLVPGDIIILGTGDEVPADLELFEATDLKIEEASMTGESVPASKTAKDRETWEGSGFAPWLALRSTRVMEGSGMGEVIATGDNTEVGKILKVAMSDDEVESPLTIQLNGLASLINKIAFCLAGLMVIILVGKYLITQGYAGKDIIGISSDMLSYILVIISVICAAVPEGLAISNTIALAMSMKKMYKDNVLVKKMIAGETMGALTLICSDKTGTISIGSMEICDTHVGKTFSLQDLLEGAAINSSASLDHSGKTVGNPSEGAMLRFIESKGQSWKEIREASNITGVKPFNSTDKYMSTTSNGTLYVKGAPEIIAKMTGSDGFMIIVKSQQEKGRRAISLAQGTTTEDLKYVGTFFIEDPCRPDVPQAVADSYSAGIDVVMMTGDCIETAKAIALDAGFNRKLQGDTEVKVQAIEAKDFKNVDLSDGKYPNVIARCKPSDKLEILRKFQGIGHICAMTGDGVNDSGSVSAAHCGFAMGSGTKVCQDSADAVLLDDSFPSIIKGVMYGRHLFASVRKFLTYQLTINVILCLTCLFAPILGQDLPFLPITIIVLNVFMDSWSALCLSTEPADPIYLKDKPRNTKDFIISKDMYKNFLGLGITMFIILSILIWNIGHPGFLPFNTDSTIVFAVFMMFNTYNLLNARVFGKSRSIFYKIGESKVFIFGWLVMFICTIAIAQFGGEVFGMRPLTGTEWFWIMVSTSSVVIIREVWWRLVHK